MCDRCNDAPGVYELHRFDGDTNSDILTENVCRGCMTPTEVRIACCDSIPELVALCLRYDDTVIDVIGRLREVRDAIETRKMKTKAEAGK